MSTVPVDIAQDPLWSLARRGVDADTAARKVEWFHAFVACGDAEEAVRRVGFPTQQNRQQVGRKAQQLVRQFQPLIAEAVQVRRAGIEPLAIKALEDVLHADHMVPLVGKDAEGNAVVLDRTVPDAKIMGVKVKAADSVLDRGSMPKGLALHGMLPLASDTERGADWRSHLDELVLHLGVDVVQALQLVQQRSDMREYMAHKYTAKDVTPTSLALGVPQPQHPEP